MAVGPAHECLAIRRALCRQPPRQQAAPQRTRREWGLRTGASTVVNVYEYVFWVVYVKCVRCLGYDGERDGVGVDVCSGEDERKEGWRSNSG